MASDVMRVRLHLRQIRVLAVVVDTPSELRVRVESTVRRPRCPHCGFKCHRVSVRDLEVSGHDDAAAARVRRLRQPMARFDGRLTRRLTASGRGAQVMTIRPVVRRHGVSWPSVNKGLVAEPPQPPVPGAAGRPRARHRYVTVIVNADTGRTLAMVEHRSSAALSAFLMSQGHKWRRGVKVVVTDGSRAYKASVDACLPHAATCWTASTSSDGSVPRSRGAPRHPAPRAQARLLFSPVQATPSPAPTRPASTL